MISIFISRIVNIFVAPEIAIKSIEQETKKKSIIIPILLLSIIYSVSFHLTKPILFEEQITRIESNERYNEEQVDLFKERMEKQKESIVPYITTLIAPLLMLFVIGGIFYFFGNFMGGGQTSFLKILLAGIYIQCIDIIAIILKVPIILSQKSMQVYTSLVLILSEYDHSSWLFKILAQFDLFRIWKIVLWIIAYKIIYGFSKNKSITLIISIWAIWMFVSAITMSFAA